MSQEKIDFLILYLFGLILLSVLTVRPMISYFIRAINMGEYRPHRKAVKNEICYTAFKR